MQETTQGLGDLCKSCSATGDISRASEVDFKACLRCSVAQAGQVWRFQPALWLAAALGRSGSLPQSFQRLWRALPTACKQNMHGL